MEDNTVNNRGEEVQYFKLLLEIHDKTVIFDKEKQNPLFIENGYGCVESFETGMLEQWKQFISTIGRSFVYRAVPGSVILSRILQYRDKYMALKNMKMFFHYSEVAQKFLFERMYSKGQEIGEKYALSYTYEDDDNEPETKTTFTVFYTLDMWAAFWAEAILLHIYSVLRHEREEKQAYILDLCLTKTEEIVEKVCTPNYYDEFSFEASKKDEVNYNHLEGQFCMFPYPQALRDLMFGYNEYFPKNLQKTNKKFQQKNQVSFCYYWSCVLFYFNSKYFDYGMLEEEDTKLFKHISVLIFNKITKEN